MNTSSPKGGTDTNTVDNIAYLVIGLIYVCTYLGGLDYTYDGQPMHGFFVKSKLLLIWYAAQGGEGKIRKFP